MSELFKTRVARHQKHLNKYLRYVLNDHFVLVCLFLLGGLGLYYSQWLKTLSADFIWAPVIAGGIWFAGLFVGQLATLVEKADTVFLLPQEAGMQRYLRQALAYSFLLPAFILLLLSGAAMPLLVACGISTFSAFPWYFLLLCLLKFSQLLLQCLRLRQDTAASYRRLTVLWLVLSIAAITASLWISPLAGLAAAILQLLVFIGLTRGQAALLDWQFMADKEQQRLHRIYQFINLFTDVPEVTAKVKRRVYLDGLLQKLQKQDTNPFYYLFLRRLFRGTEFFGLYLRLVVIGAVLAVLTADPLIIGMIGALFLYLIGFQMLPLAAQFRYMTMAALYPVSSEAKERAMMKIMSFLLIAAAVIFGFAAGIGLRSAFSAMLFCAGLLFETFLFLTFYAPKRLRKMTA